MQSLLSQGAAEMETARRAGFIPICAAAEAAALSKRHQPPSVVGSGKESSSAAAHKDWVARAFSAIKEIGIHIGEWWWSGERIRGVWVALEWAPRKVAQFLFWAVPSEFFLGLAEGVPGADTAILSMKRLSEDRGWVAGRTYARWQLHDSSTDVLRCK